MAKNFREDLEEVVNHLTEQIIRRRDFEPETVTKLQDITKNTSNIVKHEIIDFLKDQDNLIEKYFSIPDNVPLVRQENGVDYTNIDESTEQELTDRVEKLKLVYKQQILLANKLKQELEYYQETVDEQCDIDDKLCDLIEQNLTEVGLQDEVAALNIHSEMIAALKKS